MKIIQWTCRDLNPRPPPCQGEWKVNTSDVDGNWHEKESSFTTMSPQKKVIRIYRMRWN